MIFRRKYKQNFTTLSNELLRGGSGKDSARTRQDGLRPEAFGVLVNLLSNREDWQVTNKQLASFWGISPNRVTGITDELEHAGYIRRLRPISENGSVSWDWEVTDTRNEFENPMLEERKLRDVNISDVKNIDVKNREPIKTINQERLSWKEELFGNPPDGVQRDAWQRWWEYKVEENHGRQPSKVKVKRGRSYFEALVMDGHADFNAVVDLAISEGWQRPGLPEWERVQAIKTRGRIGKLLGAIK